MRKAVTIAALALTVGVGACATGAQEEGFTRADQDAIRQKAADMEAAFNAKEIDKVVAHYADNSVFMPPNVPRIRGQELLRDFYNDLLGKGATNLDLEPEEIVGHGPLAFGLNRLAVEMEDAEGVVGRDTLDAVHLPLRFEEGPPLPQPRGGHTGTTLHDEQVLVAGGTPSLTTQARAEAFVFSPSAQAWRERWPPEGRGPRPCRASPPPCRSCSSRAQR